MDNGSLACISRRMKRTFVSFVLLLMSVPLAHADLLIDFLDGSTGADSYVTDDGPFGNAIALRVQTGSATFTGGISGTGEIYKYGAGTLLMTGVYSHLGTTTARGGVMDLTGQITQTSAVGVGGDNTGGELRLRAGGSIVSGPVFIGPFTTSGTSIVTVDGAGTTWTVVPIVTPAPNPGEFRVGDLNDGTLTIQNGALVSSVRGIIGNGVGADGFATVTGTNSKWINSERMLIGINGGGNLTVSAGGRVENSFARLGEKAGSTGTVLVTGANSTWASSGDLFVGNLGNGSLTISSGGTASSVGTSRIADTASTTGSVTLTGAGSTWTNTGLVLVGNNGTGSLSLASGAQVTTTTMTLANIAGSSGTVQLDGTAGSQAVLATGRLNAGSGTALFNWNGGILRATATRTDFLLDFGVGEIDVQAGGAFLDSNGFDIGSNSALVGAGGLVKSGAGMFTYTGSALLFGVTSINGGGMTIGAGGSYFPSGVGVGRDAGTTGTLRVTGTGAVLNGGNFITVGDGLNSTGTLTVDGGGLVRMSSGARLTVGWQNATGTLNLDADGTIEVGGTDGLQKHATGTTTINFGGGTLRVVNASLTTSLPIALTANNSTLDTNGFNATLSGALSGAGGLLKTGAGTLTLNAPSSYTGGTQINDGTLLAGIAGALVPDRNVNINAGTLDLNGFSAQIGELSGAGGTVFVGGASLTVNQNTSSTYSGSISGSGNFVKSGNGLFVLIGNSNFVGITSANGGSLSVSAGAQFTSMGIGVGRMAGSSANMFVNSAGTVVTATSFMTVGDAPGSNGLVNVTTGARLTMAPGAKLTVGWADATGTLSISIGAIVEIGGTDGLQKHPTGTSNVNLSNGTIRVVHANLTTAVDVRVTSDLAIFDTNGFSATISGSLNGVGGLNKIGAGDLILSGSNSVQGSLFALGGGVEVRGQSSFGGFSVARQDGATVTALVSGAGAELNAGAFLTVGDNPGSTGTLTIDNGALVRMNSGAKLTVGWVGASGTLNLNPGGTVELGGTDGLQRHATGIAQINLAGGTFRVVNSDFTTSLPMTLSGTGSTFDTNGFNATVSGALTGNGSLAKIGLGTLFVNGTVGAITLDGGSLAPGTSPGTLNAASLDWLSGSVAFDLGADAASSDLLILSGALNGPGNLFNFTFANNGWLAGQTYELIRFGSTNITAAEFAFTNGNGFDGTFAYDGNSLEFTLVTVPEPGVAASLSLGLAALGFTRRRSPRLEV